MNRFPELVKKLSFITLLSTSSLVAEATVVKGTVTDLSTDEPLIGATIYIEKLGNGTVTDIDGNYLLDLKPGVYTFLSKYIGYKDYLTKGIDQIII